MPRKPRKPRVTREPISPAVRAYFETGILNGFETFVLTRDDWGAHSSEVLRDWILAHPGSRPWAWWECDAPRWGQIFDAFYDGQLPEPRRRIGGIGTPRYEVLAYVPSFSFGLPTGFVSAAAAAYYNGRAQNVRGNPIGTEYKEGNFAGVAIDVSDPPQFESQAAYLDRHGLLTPAEKRWLASHPEALEPEVVVYDEVG